MTFIRNHEDKNEKCFFVILSQIIELDHDYDTYAYFIDFIK